MFVMPPSRRTFCALLLTTALAGGVLYSATVNRAHQAAKNHAATVVSQEVRLADFESRRDSLEARLATAGDGQIDRIHADMVKMDKQISCLKYELGEVVGP
jgi:hypothetical protein